MNQRSPNDHSSAPSVGDSNPAHLVGTDSDMMNAADEPNPSLEDEESKAPYNEAKARAEFGDDFVDRLKNEQQKFRGDWCHLARIIANLENDKKSSPLDPDEWLRDWNAWYEEMWKLHGRKGFEYIHLENANLKGAQLSFARLYLGHFEGANFGFANFRYADLGFAHLDNAKLAHADLNHARLFGAWIENAYLLGADLACADLVSARLTNAQCYGASFDRAWLNDTDFTQSNLQKLRGTLFDNNRIRDVDIEGDAPDPWSVLRRTYTGPRFFVHLLLLVLFFAPYVGRAAYLSATGHLEWWALDKYAELGDHVAQQKEALPEFATIHAELNRRFEKTHEKRRAVWLLLGDKAGLAWVLPVVVIVYNVLRGYLTIRVSMLRDAEERSQRTPKLEEYFGVCHPLNRNGHTSWWHAICYALTGPPIRESSRNGSQRAGLRGQISAAQSFMHSRWLWLSEIPRRFGLYRLHLIARVLFWAAIVIVGWNTFSWARNTWVWVSVP